MTRGTFGQPLNIGDMLTALTGQPRRGDCPDCDAHSRLIEHTPGIYTLEIHHDDTCPAWRAAHRTPRRGEHENRREQ